MTKGVREFAVSTFNSTLAQRAELGNTKFRKTVMDAIQAAFNVSLSSSSTHYNHALQLAKKDNSTAVEGLGRPDDKKGGRKPIHVVDVVKVRNGEVVATGLSRAAAEKLIAAAVASNKAKLKIKEVEVVAETAPAADAGLNTAALESGATETATDAAPVAGAAAEEAAAA